MEIHILYVLAFIQFGLAGLVCWRFERKISRIEISVVRQVMEESPELISKILKTHETLRYNGLSPEVALREAKILHGLSSSIWGI